MLQHVDSAQMPCKSKYQIRVVNYERLAEFLCTGRGCEISNEYSFDYCCVLVVKLRYCNNDRRNCVEHQQLQMGIYISLMPFQI